MIGQFSRVGWRPVVGQCTGGIMIFGSRPLHLLGPHPTLPIPRHTIPHHHQLQRDHHHPPRSPFPCTTKVAQLRLVFSRQESHKNGAHHLSARQHPHQSPGGLTEHGRGERLRKCVSIVVCGRIGSKAVSCVVGVDSLQSARFHRQTICSVWSAAVRCLGLARMPAASRNILWG